ncbi:MAG: GLPGLI family protein [Bacteroidaceae bacterium]|nr:GLPGLI family protein [Bacteroidaceae bacterium]
MNKILLTMMAFTLTIAAEAQTNDSIDQAQIVVVYDFVTNTTDRNGAVVKDSAQLAVMIGSHAAKCMEFNRTMMEDFGEFRNKDYQLGEWNARKYNLPVLFIGYPEGEVSSFDKVVPNRYFYTEALPDFGWKLTDDTLTVSGYHCQKAVGNYAGRTWIAWYSEEVPARFGPWKLSGLPGVILKAEDSDGIFSFLCMGLMQRTAPIKYFSKDGYTTLKRDKFIAHRNKLYGSKQYVQQPNYYIPQGTYDHLNIIEMWPGGPEPPAEEKLSVVATDMIIPKKVNHYQPLELK